MTYNKLEMNVNEFEHAEHVLLWYYEGVWKEIYSLFIESRA